MLQSASAFFSRLGTFARHHAISLDSPGGRRSLVVFLDPFQGQTGRRPLGPTSTPLVAACATSKARMTGPFQLQDHAFSRACTDTSAFARVAELWRYPVKSMRGESVASLEILADSIAGDRRFAIESSGAPAGKPLLTGSERAAMLLYSARTVEGQVFVRTPEAVDYSLEDPSLLDVLQSHLQQRDGREHRLRLVCSDRPLTDCRPISVLSQEAVWRLDAEFGAPVDARRFRANILLSFSAEPTRAGAMPESAARSLFEDSLVGRRVLLGGAALRITERDPRCRMVTLDPETAEPAPLLMKLIDRRHGGRVGVYAAAVTAGTVHVGDAVMLAS